MGSGSSKPAPSDTQHVFTRYTILTPQLHYQNTTNPTPSETPIRFSQQLVDALQASPETDSTRAKDLELHIQSRVATELRRLESETSKSLAELEASISASPDSTTASTNPAAQAHVPDQTNSHGGVDQKAKAEGDRKRDLSRVSVQREIEALKEKLGKRQVKEEVVNDQGVKKAREEVVTCLRVNDRRPLDCWREVEAFRREVGRLEGAYLGRVLQ